MDLGFESFIGVGDILTDALDRATGKVKEWLARHQWRNPDGIGTYRFTTTAVSGHDGWAVIITAYGPTPETPRDEPATGDTVRLR